ncbi:MAG: phosphopyruvate hydratase [Desulfobacterales bacterium]|jgi:enolase
MPPSKPKLADINALEIIDNRGMPTIRATVQTETGHRGTADVPCGSSTGAYEAREVRDGGSRYQGKGVRQAIRNINEKILPALKGIDITRQREIDLTMCQIDGTSNKSSLGANAILGVSLAAAKAAAACCGLPLYRYLNAGSHVLPVPQACLINGGLHAGNDLDIQEYCVMPVGADSFSRAVEMLCDIFQALREILLQSIGKPAVNSSEDGGFAPPLSRSAEAMRFLVDAVEAAGHSKDVVYALDFAAGGFFDPTKKIYRFEGDAHDAEGMIEMIGHLLEQFPAIVSIEDPLHEDDLEGWQTLTRTFASRMVVGDDLFATNIGRLRQAISLEVANATLCKLNQIGTLTEAIDAARYAQRNGYPVVMSVRSGETEDPILSDVSVALDAGLFKTGGIRGSDRGTNYNRFMEIEAELGSVAQYAGYDYKRVV